MSKSDLALRKLTPEAAINFGYDHHGRQDLYASPEARALAARAMAEFEAIQPSSGSDDAWYYSQVASIVLSHGNGITNLKKQHINDLKAAELFLESRKELLSQSQTWGAFFRGAWKVAGAFAMSVFGFTLTKSLSLLGIVPGSFLNQAGHTETAASILVAVVFFVITGIVTTWWNNQSIGRVNKEYTALSQNAHVNYAKGKQVELDTNWQKLCALWKDYTGEEWGEMPAYMRFIKSDVALTLERTRILQDTSRSTFGLLGGELVRHARRLKGIIARKPQAAPAE